MKNLLQKKPRKASKNVRRKANAKKITSNLLQKTPGIDIVGQLFVGNPTQVFERLIQAANAGDDRLARQLIGRLARDRLTPSLLRDIEKHVRGLRFDSYLALDETKQRFYWKRSLPLDQDVSLPAAYAMVMVLAISSGDAERVGQCQAIKGRGGSQTCGKFFLGNSNKKFCSTTCASRSAVYAKRDRDEKKRGLE